VRWLFFFLMLGCLMGPVWAQGVAIRVEVEGVEGAALNNVLAYLSIIHYREDLALTEGQIQRLHQRAPQEIKSALEVYGYYQVQVEPALEKRPEEWVARYRIEPGPRMRIGQINLEITGEGSKDPAFQELQRKFPVKIGDPLDHARYERSRGSLQRLAEERGYFQANFIKQQLLIDLEAYSASISLHFDTGPRYRFGPVIFPETVIRPQLLTRYVPFEENEFYTASGLIELQSALADSGYFTFVEAQPHPELADLKVPISVHLEARKRHRYSIGAGFGTDTGPRINFDWVNRYVNHRGHRFGLGLRASGIRQAFDANYTIPIGDPRTDQFGIAANFGQHITPTWNSLIGQAGVNRVKARRNWRETVFLNYHWEDFNIDGQTGAAALLIPGAAWFRVQADDFTSPRRGNRINVELRGAAQALVSDLSFAQIAFRGKMVRSLGRRSRLLLRGDIGATLVSNFAELPASLRYFAGGDQSIRGYAFSSLGAKGGEGRIIGGRNLLVGSLEYDYRLFDRWTVAAFYDVGNAFNDFSIDVREGAGVGIRWISPVGPIRIDVAAALSKPGNPLRLHIYLGPDL
jgi:translocation and assembly module TamA